MQIAVRNQNGDVLESIELDDAVFNVPMNPTLVHQAMVIYQGNKRQGTADTKDRSEVSGGGRKPWTQKHTGRARQGSIRAPQWRHGGVAFGPHPRSYRADLPKRMKRLALRCVLSDKARKDHLFCLDSTDTIDGKTKSMAQLMENLSVSRSTLFVTKGSDKIVVQAAHNLEKVWTLPVNQLNALELLSKDTIIMTVEAVRWLEETLATEPHGRRGTKWAIMASANGGVAIAEPETEEAAPAVDDEAAATKPRRRRTAAAEEEVPKPRVRKPRATASATDEPAAPEAETPEEEA